MNAILTARMRFALPFMLLPLLVTGCVQESDADGARVYTYEMWVPTSVLLLGLAAGPVGFAMRERSGRLGWGLMIAGPVAAFFFAPSLFRDRVVVANDGFHVRSGIWGLTAVHSVKFADLQRIRITSETSRTRRGGKRTNYYFVCERKDGSVSKVPVSGTISEAASEQMLLHAIAYGVPIVNEAWVE